MSKVYTEATMSLDGFIADASHGGIEHLFGWYGNGEVTVPTARADMSFQVSAASAGHLRKLLDNIGALVVGRRVFDLAEGWGGRHPLGVPLVVLTHQAPEQWRDSDAPFTFVDDGIESAVKTARQLAGGREVGVNGGTIARQCLDAGLLDEIRVNLAPVLLGEGVPFFGSLGVAPVALDGPHVVEGTGVTHLTYQVRRG